MTLQPLYDRVLLKRQAVEDKTKGGLYIPHGAAEKNHLCTVVAVGNGRLADDGKINPLKVEVGQTVLIGKWSGDEIKVDGEDQLMVRETDILAVVVG